MSDALYVIFHDGTKAELPFESSPVGQFSMESIWKAVRVDGALLTSNCCFPINVIKCLVLKSAVDKTPGIVPAQPNAPTTETKQ